MRRAWPLGEGGRGGPVGGGLLLDELVKSLWGESRPVGVRSARPAVAGAHWAVVVATVRAEVARYRARVGMGADRALVPAGQWLLAGRRLEHVAVVTVPGFGMRPALTAISLLELPEESPSSTLAVEDDAEADNSENESQAAEGNTNASPKGYRAVVRCRHGRVCRGWGGDDNRGGVEGTTLDRDCRAVPGFLLATRIQHYSVVSQEIAIGQTVQA